MNTLVPRILDLLVTPPGNLIFHLVLAFSVLASLQAVLISRRNSVFQHANRLVFGLSMLLIGQLVLFLSSGLAWQGIVNPHILLPVLDRAVAVFSLVWIVWLWAFPRPSRLGDLITGFLNLGILILFLFTYSSWSTQGAEIAFNLSWADWAWELASLFIVLIGMALLLFSRPAGWGFGLGMLSLHLAGVVGHITLMSANGDFSGLIRLGQIAAYPLLPTLLNRLSDPVQAAPVVTISPIQRPNALPERRRYSSDPRTVHAWLELKQQSDPQKVVSSMAKAIAYTMLSDLCFIITGPEYGQVVLQGGYDLVREEEIPGTAFDQNEVPTLVTALQRAKVVRSSSGESQPADFLTLGSALNLTDLGSMMMLPLMTAEKMVGGILLLSPYSNREWTENDQGYLSSEIENIARILLDAQSSQETQFTAERMELELSSLQSEIEELRRENQQLLQRLEDSRMKVEEIRSQPAEAETQDMVALIALQQEAQNQIDSLTQENERLMAALQRPGNGISFLEAERMEADLRATLQAVAHLQNELAEANAKVLMLERQTSENSGHSAENREVITSIAQDLSQPMSSIMGYTDLLLGESVGILGALQRKFLERVRASTERMRSLLDDMIQVTAMGKEPLKLLRQPVNLGTVIDGAMSDTSAQLREKNITLRMDLPQDNVPFYGDQDAIQQILVHLLQNAGAVTPQEGTITLRARQKEEAGEAYVLLQVTDTGGGIQTDQIQKVFSRRYRADHPLINGLGDTGVGLSIAKTLVEAHGGRIWVESEAGQTTTFSVLLPTGNRSVETAVE